MGVSTTVEGMSAIFKEKIDELEKEPEFQWSRDDTKYAVGPDGRAAVKVAVGNVPLDYDLWKGLRNPAIIGLYPVGLREIWDFYSNRTRERIDESGRQTIFQTLRSYDYASKNYGRVIVVSVMLPFSDRIVQDYAGLFTEKRKGSSHIFSRMYESLNLMLDRATRRTALEMVSTDTVVVPMDNEMVKNVSAEAVPLTHQGASHGPSKGGNYPQKSMAALMGLGQFGIQRIIFRDEVHNGRVERFTGPIRSIVMFDKGDVVKDGSGDIIYPTDAWREYLFRLFDFGDTDQEVNRHRFCTYIPDNDEGCGKCIGCCPSGAQANSVPGPTGKYSEQISKQEHRFWEDKLQFDFGRCCEERGQMTTMYPEWSCARCATICMAQGNTRLSAVQRHYEKKLQLTRE